MTRDEIRQAIRESRDINIEPVPTPEWPVVNGQVHVRTMNLVSRDAYLANIRRPDGTTDVSLAGIRLVIAASCTDTGEAIFTDDDEEMLSSDKSWAAVQRIQDAAARLNGLTKTARVDAKNESPSATT
jgi:hypothetical protein